MRLVFIHGPAASGKLTVARELAALTGLPLFHNHLIVDALLAVFPFGSDVFVELREAMWLDVFRAAATEKRSLIFTFHPEASVAPDFPQPSQRWSRLRVGGSISWACAARAKSSNRGSKQSRGRRAASCRR